MAALPGWNASSCPISLLRALHSCLTDQTESDTLAHWWLRDRPRLLPPVMPLAPLVLVGARDHSEVLAHPEVLSRVIGMRSLSCLLQIWDFATENPKDFRDVTKTWPKSETCQAWWSPPVGRWNLVRVEGKLCLARTDDVPTIWALNPVTLSWVHEVFNMRMENFIDSVTPTIGSRVHPKLYRILHSVMIWSLDVQAVVPSTRCITTILLERLDSYWRSPNRGGPGTDPTTVPFPAWFHKSFPKQRLAELASILIGVDDQVLHNEVKTALARSNLCLHPPAIPNGFAATVRRTFE